jgi:hypothetical protein
MDDVMARMQAADEQANTYSGCGPRLNEPKDASEWLGTPDGPAAQLDDEKPQGETDSYEEITQRWASQKRAPSGPGAGQPARRRRWHARRAVRRVPLLIRG